MEQKEKRRSLAICAIIVAVAVVLVIAVNVLFILTQMNRNVFSVEESVPIDIPATAEIVDSSVINTPEKDCTLDLAASVYYDQANEKVYAELTASWRQRLGLAWKAVETAEENYMDYFSISWNRGTVNREYTIGNYYNDKPVQIAATDAGMGYLWMFDEKSGFLGKEARLLKACVEIDVSDLGGDFAGMQVIFSYIHTYGRTINVHFDYSGSIGNATWDHTEGAWKVVHAVANFTA